MEVKRDLEALARADVKAHKEQLIKDQLETHKRKEVVRITPDSSAAPSLVLEAREPAKVRPKLNLRKPPSVSMFRQYDQGIKLATASGV